MKSFCGFLFYGLTSLFWIQSTCKTDMDVDWKINEDNVIHLSLGPAMERQDVYDDYGGFPLSEILRRALSGQRDTLDSLLHCDN